MRQKNYLLLPIKRVISFGCKNNNVEFFKTFASVGSGVPIFVFSYNIGIEFQYCIFSKEDSMPVKPIICFSGVTKYS
jgi:hypothetical protein